MESEAPFVNAEFLTDLGFNIPTKNSVLSIYEDVGPGDAAKQAQEIPSPLGKNKTQFKMAHAEDKDTEDLFNLTVSDGSYDNDTIFHYEGSYIHETSNKLYAGMRWVQRFSLQNGAYVLVLFKSRIHHYRTTHWHQGS